MKNFLLLFVLFTCFSFNASAQKKTAAKKKAINKTVSKPADMLTMLQGRWASLDDKKTFFQVEENKQINIYGRDILDTSIINFYPECPHKIETGDEQRKSGKYLITSSRPNDFYCYSIETITPQQLVLLYLPKGSILRYKKVPLVKLRANTEIEEDQD